MPLTYLEDGKCKVPFRDTAFWVGGQGAAGGECTENVQHVNLRGLVLRVPPLWSLMCLV